MSIKGVSSYPIKKDQRFGRLVVLASPFIAKRGVALVRCRCDCGKTSTPQARYLLNGHTRSCGCSRRTHGCTGTPTHDTWSAMRDRCGNPRSPNYPKYGARGIRVCTRWDSSFPAFLADMGERPDRTYSIDRIDRSKGYFKGNCRWATARQQMNNRECNRRLTVGTKTHTLAEWSALSGVPETTISTRLGKGWSTEDAVFLPWHRGKRWRTTKRSEKPQIRRRT